MYRHGRHVESVVTSLICFFFFNDTATTEIYTLSLHDALPISKRPHVVVSDIGMPDIDGYEFLKQLRQIPGMTAVPAIAVSGYASDDDRHKALTVGYATLVPKPIDVDVLFDLIHELNL